MAKDEKGHHYFVLGIHCRFSKTTALCRYSIKPDNKPGTALAGQWHVSSRVQDRQQPFLLRLGDGLVVGLAGQRVALAVDGAAKPPDRQVVDVGQSLAGRLGLDLSALKVQATIRARGGMSAALPRPPWNASHVGGETIVQDEDEGEGPRETHSFLNCLSILSLLPWSKRRCLRKLR